MWERDKEEVFEEETSCQMAITELILKKAVDGEEKDNVLEALGNAKEIKKEAYFEIVDKIEGVQGMPSYELKIVLMNYWILANRQLDAAEKWLEQALIEEEKEAMNKREAA